MILSAQSIRRLCVWSDSELRPNDALIVPFHERHASHGLSGGLSACGYDVHIKQGLWLWPFWGRLASTIERIALPAQLRGEVSNKSSLARRFIWQPNTTCEPGWRGYLTLELINLRPWPVRIKSGAPIAQIIFQRLDQSTDEPYHGRYQNQGDAPQAAILASPDNVGLKPLEVPCG